MAGGFTYIVASRRRGAIYVGVTQDLSRRIWEHKEKIFQGHTAKYRIDKLVYYEAFDDIVSAIEREKQLKRWHRKWKLNLIEESNPNWDDLYQEFL